MSLPLFVVVNRLWHFDCVLFQIMAFRCTAFLGRFASIGVGTASPPWTTRCPIILLHSVVSAGLRGHARFFLLQLSRLPIFRVTVGAHFFEERRLAIWSRFLSLPFHDLQT